ncbi:hypothetical protein N7520_003882 [Penicillium odoratum]|uniref:uncharacterized protein n=1 Tax=Penicillium odoratum TaxID=1167516 RepID=UPI002548E445|nr:uncharacterized protein N7520_003882 [Penicillium odoratum]KAJ5769323.1 hypothetical protein N7520_003882 [Penicillium odoratum]
MDTPDFKIAVLTAVASPQQPIQLALHYELSQYQTVNTTASVLGLQILQHMTFPSRTRRRWHAGSHLISAGWMISVPTAMDYTGSTRSRHQETLRRSTQRVLRRASHNMVERRRRDNFTNVSKIYPSLYTNHSKSLSVAKPKLDKKPKQARKNGTSESSAEAATAAQTGG